MQQIPSTKPYMVRALHEWCTDHGFTPYLAVSVDQSVQVPLQYVRDGEIVLNVSYEATSQLVLGAEYVEFMARFGGVSQSVMVPYHRVLAIYARENGQGMAFPVETPVSQSVEKTESKNFSTLEAGQGPKTGDNNDLKRSQLEVVSGSKQTGFEPSEGDPIDRSPNPPGGKPSLRRIK